MNATDFPPGYLEEYNGRSLWVSAIVFPILVVSIVALRFTARALAKLAFSLEDAYIVVATIMQLGVAACCFVFLLAGGVGYHVPVWLMSDPGKITVWAKTVAAIPIPYLASVAFAKLSITTLYMRIFPQRWLRYLIWALQATIVVHLVVGFIVTLVQCVPLQKLWEPDIPGTCIENISFFVWISFPNIITDAIILVVPLPIISTLHMARGAKLGLALTFVVGGIGLAVSIARFKLVFHEAFISDVTWTAGPISLWSLVECSTYIVAISLLSFRPLLARLNATISKYRTKMGSRTTGNSQYTRFNTSQTASIGTSIKGKKYSDDREGQREDNWAGGDAYTLDTYRKPAETFLSTRREKIEHCDP